MPAALIDVRYRVQSGHRECARGRVSTFAQKGQFQASKKYHLALIKNDFAPAF
jgi:hypothetical protein